MDALVYTEKEMRGLKADDYSDGYDDGFREGYDEAVDEANAGNDICCCCDQPKA